MFLIPQAARVTPLFFVPVIIWCHKCMFYKHQGAPSLSGSTAGCTRDFSFVSGLGLQLPPWKGRQEKGFGCQGQMCSTLLLHGDNSLSISDSQRGGIGAVKYPSCSSSTETVSCGIQPLKIRANLQRLWFPRLSSTLSWDSINHQHWEPGKQPWAGAAKHQPSAGWDLCMFIFYLLFFVLEPGLRHRSHSFVFRLSVY